MIYDEETDEMYMTRKEEAYYLMVTDGFVTTKCCVEHRDPQTCVMVGKDYICSECKSRLLQSGDIALCLDCGDYFWTKPDEVNPIRCGAYIKSGGAG